AQVVSKWHDRLQDPLRMLRQLANDPSSKVRLHALVALSYIHLPESIVIGAQVFDYPMDKFIRYAWSKTVYTLRPVWEIALKKDSLHFQKPVHLAHVLNNDPPSWFPSQKMIAL